MKYLLVLVDGNSCPRANTKKVYACCVAAERGINEQIDSLANSVHLSRHLDESTKLCFLRFSGATPIAQIQLLRSNCSDPIAQIQLLRSNCSDPIAQIQLLRSNCSDPIAQIQLLIFNCSYSIAHVQSLISSRSDPIAQIQLLRSNCSDPIAHIQLLRFSWFVSELADSIIRLILIFSKCWSVFIQQGSAPWRGKDGLAIRTTRQWIDRTHEHVADVFSTTEST